MTNYILALCLPIVAGGLWLLWQIRRAWRR